jgi:predicted XRE-type DNA-binding protein
MSTEDVEVKTGDIETPTGRKARAQERVQRILAGADGRVIAMRELHKAVQRKDWEILTMGDVSNYLHTTGIWAAIAKAARQEERALPALVAELRAAELTQAATAELLGISQGRVSQLQRGKTGHESKAKPVTSGYKQANNSGGDPTPDAEPKPDEPTAAPAMTAAPPAPDTAKPDAFKVPEPPDAMAELHKPQQPAAGTDEAGPAGEPYEVVVTVMLEISADSPAGAAQRARERLAGFSVEDITVHVPGDDDVVFEDGHEVLLPPWAGDSGE